jgi:hypothetical protein
MEKLLSSDDFVFFFCYRSEKQKNKGLLPTKNYSLSIGKRAKCMSAGSVSKITRGESEVLPLLDQTICTRVPFPKSMVNVNIPIST